MSWDVFVFGGENPPPQPPDGDWTPPAMGTVSEVRSKLEKCLPGLEWDGYGFGMSGADGAGFEIHPVETDGIVDVIIITVRGGGDPFPTFRAIARETNWHIVEDSMNVIDLNNAADSQWQEAQEYTRRAVQKPEEP